MQGVFRAVQQHTAAIESSNVDRRAFVPCIESEPHLVVSDTSGNLWPQGSRLVLFIWRQTWVEKIGRRADVASNYISMVLRTFSVFHVCDVLSHHHGMSEGEVSVLRVRPLFGQALGLRSSIRGASLRSVCHPILVGSPDIVSGPAFNAFSCSSSSSKLVFLLEAQRSPDKRTAGLLQEGKTCRQRKKVQDEGFRTSASTH